MKEVDQIILIRLWNDRLSARMAQEVEGTGIHPNSLDEIEWALKKSDLMPLSSAGPV